MLNAQELLKTLTLGTTRSPLPPEVNDYLDLREATDPTADAAERTLAAYTLTERLARLVTTKTEAPTTTEPIVEERRPASPKLGRALSLVFTETYESIRPEAIQVVKERGLLIPPQYLPALLDHALTFYKNRIPHVAEEILTAGGHRANWLAEQHPEWKYLTTDFDYQEAWNQAGSDLEKIALLTGWRYRDATAAREAATILWPGLNPTNQHRVVNTLQSELSDDDLPWLRERLAPRRKQVRRAILVQLILGREEQAIADMTDLAVASLSDTGAFVNVLKKEEAKELLKSYGGLNKGESISEFILWNTPPTLVADLLGKSLTEFWSGLTKKEFSAAGWPLLKCEDPTIKKELLHYLLRANPTQFDRSFLMGLFNRMPHDDFNAVINKYLQEEKDGFRYGSTAHLLVLNRNEPWSERITKAYINGLLEKLRSTYNLPYATLRGLSDSWKAAIPLLHVATFPWLRQQLHSMTERPDQFGKLALNTLQTTAFRKLLYEA